MRDRAQAIGRGQRPPLELSRVGNVRPSRPLLSARRLGPRPLVRSGRARVRRRAPGHPDRSAGPATPAWRAYAAAVPHARGRGPVLPPAAARDGSRSGLPGAPRRRGGRRARRGLGLSLRSGEQQRAPTGRRLVAPRSDRRADPDRARRAEPRSAARHGREAPRGDSERDAGGDSRELPSSGARQPRRIRSSAGGVSGGVDADAVSARRAGRDYRSMRKRSMASGSSSTPSPGPGGTRISPFTGTMGSVTTSAASAPLTPTANTPSISAPGQAAESCATAAVATLVLGWFPG